MEPQYYEPEQPQKQENKNLKNVGITGAAGLAVGSAHPLLVSLNRKRKSKNFTKSTLDELSKNVNHSDEHIAKKTKEILKTREAAKIDPKKLGKKMGVRGLIGLAAGSGGMYALNKYFNKRDSQ